MAQKYRRHATGGSFKRQDFGDLGLRSFREQQNEITEALKLQQARAKEYGDDYITDLKGVGRTEEENKRILNELETKAYETRRRALNVRAEREVSFIRSQAEEAGKKSDYWKDFSTTKAGEFAKLAQGLRDYGDYRYAQSKLENPDHQRTQSSYLTLETGLEKAGENIAKTTAIEQDPWASKKTNEFQGSRSDTHGKNEEAHFNKNIDPIVETFQHRIAEDPNISLTVSNGKVLGDNYIINYLESVDVHPNSRAGLAIRKRWGNKITRLLNKQYDVEEAGRDKETLIKFIKTFENTPTQENMHILVQHVRTMHYEDKNGIQKTSAKRNKAESWIHTAQLLLQYGDKSLTWMQNYDQFHNKVFNMMGLKDDKTGLDSTENFSIKAARRIDNEFAPQFVKLINDHINKENALTKLNEETLPILKIRAELATDKTKRHDWSPEGWIMTTRRKLQTKGNLNAIAKFEEMVGWDKSKHTPFVTHAQLMDAKQDLTLEGVRRTIYLLEQIEDEGDEKGYIDINTEQKGVRAFVESGVFSKPIFKTFGENTVRESFKDHNLPGNTSIRDTNALAVIEALEQYRGRMFTQLDPDKFKTHEARMIEAQRLTRVEFDKGLKDGIGWFAAKKPGDGYSGQMKVVWTNFDGEVDVNNAILTPAQMLDKFDTSNKTGTPLTNLEKDGGLINKDRGSPIVTSIIKGEWDGRIPENVKTYAALRGIDEKEALNSILGNLGFTNVRVPVSSFDQLIRSDRVNTFTPRNPRHDKSMMMWKSFVKSNIGRDPNWQPKAGPLNNPAFNSYTEHHFLAKRLSDGGYIVRNRQAEKYRAQERVGGTDSGSLEWGPGGQPSASKQLNIKQSENQKRFFLNRKLPHQL